MSESMRKRVRERYGVSDDAGSSPSVSTITKIRPTGRIYVIMIDTGRGSKDERHRATVRWTVATASDQADPVGAIEPQCFFQLNPPLRVD